MSGGSSGGSARIPVEAPDTLRSRQYARALDLLCEGEVEGPAKPGLQWFYLDKTPIENADGSRNFDGVTVAYRTGTQAQSHIKGFTAAETEKPVNVQVTNETSVARTITNPDIDAVRVTISLPALYAQDVKTGDTNGAATQIAIDVQPDGGSYTQALRDLIVGKASSKYQRSYYVALEGSPPWNVRVRHLPPDVETNTIQRDTFWDSYTEIIEAKLRYPNSAIVATIIDSAQFSSVPERAFDWKLLKTQIPSNATVDPGTGRLTYSGTWDGTFQVAWHSNPAWAFWDMLTEGRYGLGDYIAADQVDKWALYQIGQYCDELVPDGYGGMEPRFSINIYMQEQQEAFNLMQDMASIFRGMVYWAAGTIMASQDAPSDVKALFTNANVVEGRFSYSGSSLKTRHTVALMSWNNPADFYKSTPEYVEDPDGIARWGIVPTSKVCVGCTSRGQAHRAGKWLLYAEAHETDVVSFQVGMDGTMVRPGEIIHVLDSARAGARRGGRVVSATTTEVTVDRGVSMEPGVSYLLEAMMPDGTVGSAAVEAVTGDVVTLAEALPDAPLPNAIFGISSPELLPQKFRVLGAVETGEGTYEIAAVAHDPRKYEHIEDDIVLDPLPVSVLNDPPGTPANITVTESLYESGPSVRVLVAIGWDVPERAARYSVSYRRNDNNLVTLPDTGAPMVEIRDAQPGTYEIFVTALSYNGKRSVAARKAVEILGKTAHPGNVKNFSVTALTNGVAQLSWAQAEDLDVHLGGFVRIRHTPLTSVGPEEWNNAVDISPALPGTATSASVPHLPGTYLAKFVDSSGVPSPEASVATTSAAALLSLNVVETVTETWAGSMENAVYDAGQGGLMIEDMATLASDPDLLAQWNYLSGFPVVGAGIYDFDASPDLGASYPCLVSARIEVVAINDEDLWDSDELTDSLELVDGDAVDDVNAILFISTTNDDPSGSPTWSAWQPFHIGQYSFRAPRFKLALTTGSLNHNIVVTSLSVTIDMPDREETGFNISSGTGPMSVTFDNAFKIFKGLDITPLNMASGDYFSITAQSADGFTLAFYNSAGTPIDRNFNFTGKGAGFQT